MGDRIEIRRENLLGTYFDADRNPDSIEEVFLQGDKLYVDFRYHEKECASLPFLDRAVCLPTGQWESSIVLIDEKVKSFRLEESWSVAALFRPRFVLKYTLEEGGEKSVAITEEFAVQKLTELGRWKTGNPKDVF